MHDLKKPITIKSFETMPMKKLKRMYGVGRNVPISRQRLRDKVIEKGFKPYAHIKLKKVLMGTHFNTLIKMSGEVGRKGLTKEKLVAKMVEQQTGWKGD